MPWIRLLFYVIVFSAVCCYMWTYKHNRLKHIFMYQDNTLNENALIRNGIFWSDIAESYVPKGLTFVESTEIIRKYRGQVVTSVDRSFDVRRKPRRRKNVVITFKDGSRFYVKYRCGSHNYAEVFYFYFTCLLQMDNVPPVFLITTNTSSEIWKEVEVQKFEWKQRKDKTMSVTYMLNNVSRQGRVPQLICDAFANGEPVTVESIRRSNMLHNNPDDVAEIVQFGSMVVIDFLAMHSDRYFLRDIVEEDYRLFVVEPNNIVVSQKSKLWAIDNEAAFFEPYLLSKPLHRTLLTKAYDKLLKSICIFQTSLVESLKILSYNSSHNSIISNYIIYEPLLSHKVKESFNLLERAFKERLTIVLQWIKHCQSIVF